MASLNLTNFTTIHLTTTFLESVCVNLKKESESFVLASYYRPPVDSLCENFINMFSNQVNTLNRSYTNILICGDFSFDFFKIDSDSKVTHSMSPQVPTFNPIDY